jgi:uncharacterized membrane protein
LWQHAAIGPIPGQVVLILGLVFHAGLIALAVFTLKGQRAVGRWNDRHNTYRTAVKS